MEIRDFLRRFLFTILLLAIFLPKSLIVAANAQQTIIKRVVIDPGHGGQDPGAVYKGLCEKDIVLSVALKLGDLIKKNYPNVKVIYTRSSDIFVPLDERGKIANKAAADLFISIHVNSTKKTAPSGTETFVMGIDKSESNLAVAMRENEVIEYESDYATKYQGYEPGSAESFIIFSLMQYAYLEQSLILADMVQKNFTSHIKSPSRGVKQAAFLVLWNTSMPSILTELGFINNSADNTQLKSAKGQEKYAKALFNAFSAYKTKTEGKGKMILLPPEDEQEDQSSTVEKPNTENNKPSEDIVFGVQIVGGTTKMNINSSVFKSYKGRVIERKVDKIYKYLIGEYSSHQVAVKSLAKAKKEFKDAFIVAFNGDKLIPVAEAKRLIEKK